MSREKKSNLMDPVNDSLDSVLKGFGAVTFAGGFIVDAGAIREMNDYHTATGMDYLTILQHYHDVHLNGNFGDELLGGLVAMVAGVVLFGAGSIRKYRGY